MRLTSAQSERPRMVHLGVVGHDGANGVATPAYSLQTYHPSEPSCA